MHRTYRSRTVQHNYRPLLYQLISVSLWIMAAVSARVALPDGSTVLPRPVIIPDPTAHRMLSSAHAEISARSANCSISPPASVSMPLIFAYLCSTAASCSLVMISSGPCTGTEYFHCERLRAFVALGLSFAVYENDSGAVELYFSSLILFIFKCQPRSVICAAE